MRVDLSNMLRQVLAILKEYSRDGDDLGAYIASIEQLRSHIQQVRDGSASLDGFADLYMLRPDDHPGAQPPSRDGVGNG